MEGKIFDGRELMAKMVAQKQSEQELSNSIYLSEDGESICINIQYEYFVPLDECRDVVGMCRWLFHLQQKAWMTNDALRVFAALACKANGFCEKAPW